MAVTVWWTILLRDVIAMARAIGSTAVDSSSYLYLIFHSRTKHIGTWVMALQILGVDISFTIFPMQQEIWEELLPLPRIIQIQTPFN